ncbi:MAG: cupredoxin domain-containing protein [Proteobacteria bacterium]|nr:cupredoxin domain-containing protein [Pseudomonadota bacterium]
MLAPTLMLAGCSIPDWKIDGRITRYTTIDDHKFKPSELTVPADTPFWLAIDGYDDMSRLIVFSKDLGIDRQKIDTHVHTSNWAETDPPERTRFPVKPLAPGRYEFTCDCHGDVVKGYITAIADQRS